MKTFIKNLSKFALAITLFTTGVTFVFAESFETDYSHSGLGITTVDNNCESGETCSLNDSVYVNIPNSGDSVEIVVSTGYMLKKGSSGSIQNPKVWYKTKNKTNLSSSSYSFETCLLADNASRICDSARVEGLPDSYSITYESPVRKHNTHQSLYPKTCNSSLYEYNETFNSSSLFNSSGYSLNVGSLDSKGDGYCSQGTVSVHYIITNTETVDPDYSYSWNTGSWSSFSSCNNKTQTRTRTVSCVRNDGFNVSNSYCPGTKPATTDTQTCSEAVNLNVVTQDESNVTKNSAKLNGYMSEGDDADVWFAFGTSTNPQCSNNSTRKDVSGTYNSGDLFSLVVNNLSKNTHYYYRACAQSGSTYDEGSRYDFYTQKDNFVTPDTYYWDSGDWSSCNNRTQYRNVVCRNNQGVSVSTGYCNGTKPSTSRSCDSDSDSPVAITKDEDDVDENSAELNGKIQMNNYDNGIVFFVYGQDKSEIEDVDSDYDEYSDIDNDGQDLRKVKVDDDNDESSWENYSKTVSGLDEDEKYYFRICVQYDNNSGDEILECGDVENFSTDDGDVNDGHDFEIKTLNPDSVSSKSAKICGDLVDDGGNSDLRTWLEIRRAGSSSWVLTDKEDRGEVRYCDTVRNLTSGVKYEYRACSDEGCASSRTFTTINNYVDPIQKKPRVTTETAYSIRSNSAVLPGLFVSNADKATVWFQYGRSQNLNKETRRYTKYGSYGEFVHNFTKLKSNQLYCYRAVIQTSAGTDTGATKCFTTPAGVIYVNNTKRTVKVVEKPKVVVVEEDDDPEIDLERLGLGLSLIRLEIDDEREAVTKGEQVTYEITWENISKLDLDNIELNVTIPREMKIVATSRGRLDQDRNAIFYTIDKLDAGEEGSMTITGIVNNGSLGDALTAEATLAFDNPVNRAQENAIDYDVDEYVVNTALGTASVFGLSQIGFLGWLTILLGLIIIFLVARWLYLEREELRAQAYVNGYGQPYMMQPTPQSYNIAPAPATTIRETHYVEPVQTVPVQQQPTQTVHTTTTTQPVQQQPINVVHNDAQVTTNERTDYRPYRPNH